MPSRSVQRLTASLLLALGTAWCGPDPVPAAFSAIQGEPRLEAVPKPEARSLAPAQRIGAPTPAPAYSEPSDLAPLAFFSLGSLAVGGAFYAIHRSTGGSNQEFSAADRASLNNAMGAAGITALLAAGSYFWFTRVGADREGGSERDWDARVSGGTGADGELGVAAMVTLPLSFLAP